MIGFSVTAGGSTVYLRFAVTDPYASVRSNRSMVYLTTSDDAMDQSHYNNLYNNGGSGEIPFDGKTLKVGLYMHGSIWY